MSRRITITLTDDDYQKAQYLADLCATSVQSYCSLAIAGTIEAELEAEASEQELHDILSLWTTPAAGNA